MRSHCACASSRRLCGRPRLHLVVGSFVRNVVQLAIPLLKAPLYITIRINSSQPKVLTLILPQIVRSTLHGAETREVRDFAAVQLPARISEVLFSCS